MADGYRANYGNDANDGLTWETSKKTFQAIKDTGLYPLHTRGDSYGTSIKDVDIGSVTTGYDTTIHGNNDIFDLALKRINLNKISVINFKEFYGSVMYWNSYFTFTNGYIANMDRLGKGNVGDAGNIGIEGIGNSVINNIGIVIISNYHVLSWNNKTNTFHNITDLFLHGKTTVGSILKYSIVSKSNIYFDAHFKGILINNLFVDCAFRFANGGLGNDETSYSLPSGTTDDDKMQTLRDRMVIVYGGVASDYLIECKYYSGSYNDIFLDADNGDFHLVPYCIAAHMTYDGEYVGPLPEGIRAQWDSDFNTVVNIGAAGFITDQDVDATTQTNILDIGHERTILDFGTLGVRAARNGQQVNSVSNLSSKIAPGTNILTDGSNYICVDDTLTLDDSAATGLLPFDTFMAVDEGGGVGLGYSTGGVGRLQEVYTDGRFDNKIQMKSSRTDATLSTANTITCFLNSDEILVNQDTSGLPTHGDADSGYNAGTAVPLRARYLQFFVTIKSWNLPVR